MKEEPVNREAEKNKICIFESLKKHFFAILATLVALGGCNISNEAKSSSGHSFFDALSKFINYHSNFFFLIIFALLIVQFIIHFIKYNHDNNMLCDKLDVLEKHQKSEIETATTGWNKALMDVNEMSNKFPVDGEKSLSEFKNEKNKIYDCLKDVHTAYVLNHSDYKYAHGRLYQYINKVSKHLDDRIKTLLDQYCN